MKKLAFLLGSLCFAFGALAQEEYMPNITVKWAPTGLFVGSISLQGEYNFGRNSVTAKIGIPVKAHHTLTYEDHDAGFDTKATSFLAGYRRYLSERHLSGLYLEPYLKYVHHTSEGTGTGTLVARDVTMNFTNDYSGAGVGVQLGAQFLISDRFVIDLFFLGPEINISSNKFKAVERSASLPWTDLEARDAERDIKDFIDKFPFIRNHTDVTIDQNNRSVTADFKGALPGFRIGVSFGVAL